jgi:hypothetical protein
MEEVGTMQFRVQGEKIKNDEKSKKIWVYKNKIKWTP